MRLVGWIHNEHQHEQIRECEYCHCLIPPSSEAISLHMAPHHLVFDEPDPTQSAG